MNTIVEKLNKDVKMYDTMALTLVSTVDLLGTSLTWTGLPVYAYSITHSIYYTTILFFTQTIASVISTIFSGHFVDRFSGKKLSSVSMILNTLLFVLLFFLISYHRMIYIIPIAIISQCFSSLANSSLDVWFNSLSNNLERDISYKNTWTMSAKTIGFSLGPIIYQLVGANAILLDALSFLCATLIIQKIRYRIPERRNYQEENIFVSIYMALLKIFKNPALRNLWIMASITGAITPSIIALSVYIIQSHYHAQAFIVSVFWLIGGVGMIASNFLLAKTKILELSQRVLVSISTMSITFGLLLMGFSNSVYGYLGGFLIVTLGNPIVFNLMRTLVFKEAAPEMKGRVTSMVSATSDLATLITLIVSWKIILTLSIPILFTLMILLAAVRSYNFWIALTNNDGKSKGEYV